MSRHIIDQPELWIRSDDTHNLTPRGRRWEWVHGTVEISAEDVRLDVVNVRNMADYIVALVYEGHEDGQDGKQGREIPVPISRYH